MAGFWAFVARSSPPALISVLFAVLALCIIARLFSSYWKLRQFKGPPLACVSELWLFKETLAGHLYLGFADVIKKYGSTARVGPSMLVTTDPVILRHMSAPRSNFTRGHWYAGMKLDPHVNNILSELNEKRHNDLRAKLIAGYSGRDIPSLEADIDDRVIDLINLIQRDYSGRKMLDFARLAQYFTLDSLTQIAFGAPFGFLLKNEDVLKYNETTNAFLPVLELGCNHPFIYSILSSRLVQALAAPKPEDRIGMGAVIGVAQKVVQERYGPDPKVRKDMLGSFVSRGLTQQEAESESMIQILAGSDSTATAIRATFLYILTNPAVYVKLLAEITDAAARGEVSRPVIKDSEAKKLPYLQACILEGLRMWPPLTGLLSKRAPPGGETVNGVFIPGGTEVAWSPMMAMRREDIFGADADIFRPERWIEADVEKRTLYERTTELVFGNGRFGCLGKNIATIELNKVFVELLRNYDWAIVDPVTPIKTYCHGIHIQSDMFLIATPRKE